MVLDRGVAAFILKLRTGRRLQSAPALAKIWNGSRYLRVLGDAVKRALR
jgi:hypothetical protein